MSPFQWSSMQRIVAFSRDITLFTSPIELLLTGNAIDKRSLRKPRREVSTLQKRLSVGRKAVTLLTTFPCKDATGNDAFIVCADAQETLGDYRFFLDKLEPRRTGNFEMAVRVIPILWKHLNCG